MNNPLFPGMAYDNLEFEISDKVNYSGSYGVYVGGDANGSMPYALANSLVLNEGQFHFDKASLNDSQRNWIELLKLTFNSIQS